MTGARRTSLSATTVAVLPIALHAPAMPVLPVVAWPATAAVGDAAGCLDPTVAYSDGPERRWTRYYGPSRAPFEGHVPFDRYDLSAGTAGFTDPPAGRH